MPRAVISLYISAAASPRIACAFERRRGERQAIRALAMQQLRARFGRRASIVLQTLPTGAPRAQVEGSAVAIGWSHTQDCQALAIAPSLSHIGVDVERAARLETSPKTALRLARRLWPADVVSGLAQLSLPQAARAAVRLWCLHEALAKCTQHGLAKTPFSLNPAALTAVLRGARASRLWWPVPTCAPYVVRLTSGLHIPRQFVVAVAAAQPARLMIRPAIAA